MSLVIGIAATDVSIGNEIKGSKCGRGFKMGITPDLVSFFFSLQLFPLVLFWRLSRAMVFLISWCFALLWSFWLHRRYWMVDIHISSMGWTNSMSFGHAPASFSWSLSWRFLSKIIKIRSGYLHIMKTKPALIILTISLFWAWLVLHTLWVVSRVAGAVKEQDDLTIRFALYCRVWKQRIYGRRGWKCCYCIPNVSWNTVRTPFFPPWLTFLICSAMVTSIITAWIFGLIYLLALLFSIQDMGAVLNTTFNLPVAQVIIVSKGSERECSQVSYGCTS